MLKLFGIINIPLWVYMYYYHWSLIKMTLVKDYCGYVGWGKCIGYVMQ